MRVLSLWGVLSSAYVGHEWLKKKTKTKPGGQVKHWKGILCVSEKLSLTIPSLPLHLNSVYWPFSFHPLWILEQYAGLTALNRTFPQTKKKKSLEQQSIRWLFPRRHFGLGHDLEFLMQVIIRVVFFFVTTVWSDIMVSSFLFLTPPPSHTYFFFLCLLQLWNPPTFLYLWYIRRIVITFRVH